MTDEEQTRLAEIEARLTATTPAPWEWRLDTELVNPNLYLEFESSKDDGPAYWQKMHEATVLAALWCNDSTADLEMSDANRQFVANAPTDIAWLIEQLRKK